MPKAYAKVAIYLYGEDPTTFTDQEIDIITDLLETAPWEAVGTWINEQIKTRLPDRHITFRADLD